MSSSSSSSSSASSPGGTKRDLPQEAAAADGKAGGDAKKAKKGSATKKKKAAKPKKLEFIARGETPAPAAAPAGGTSLRILSTNVAGLRAVLGNEDKRAAFASLVTKNEPDVLCLQEHKLQEAHVDDIKADLKKLLPSYGTNTYWTCSRGAAKKGYSGVACLLKDGCPEPERVSFSFAQDGDGSEAAASTTTTALGAKVAEEGRIINLEFPWVNLVVTYVPNSGQKLDRLEYRVNEWDQHMTGHLKSMQGMPLEEKEGAEGGDAKKTNGKPVVWTGDLNVAHGFRDMHNFYDRPEFPEIPGDGDAAYKGIKQLLKQAGCTPAERESFTGIMEKAGLVDSFRALYPDATGCFTYWSQRAGNRGPNRGLRLDYFIASRALLEADGGGGGGGGGGGSGPRLVSTFMCDNLEEYPAFSDHAAVGCVLYNPAS